MNNIKPQWMIISTFIVSALWLTEMTNRPDDIPDYSETMQKRHSKVSSMAVGKVSSSVLDNVDKKATSERPLIRNNRNPSPANSLSAYTQVDRNVILAQEQPFSQKLSSSNDDTKMLSQKAFQAQVGLSEY
ncbi:hypothetical protein ACH42_03120 [Endozoicomonas sp. (ex Bugula neritina AB1)]|nr:hypothetical protein ACH42_03120 [Endozoicomonas sp. (ex Bugula neritina AB1)]